VIVDETAPTIVFNDPTPADGEFVFENFDVSFTATDDNVDTCRMFSSSNIGIDWTEQYIGIVSCDDTKDFPISWCPPMDSPTLKSCGVRIEATDTVGNMSSTERLFTINSPPDITLFLVDTDPPPQTYTITNGATIDATVLDDGFPGPLTYEWEQLSGLGTATFLPNAFTEDVDVSFTDLGDYELKLTASDGQLESFDTVWVTIRHEAPVVDAGPNQTVNLNLPFVQVSLTGSSTDDGFPLSADLTNTWSSVPDTVDFDDKKALQTTADFFASGEYTLTLTADDGEFTSEDLLSVTVINAEPVADAGLNTLEIDFGFPTNLAGSATDDNLPTPTSLITTWSRTDGPGKATFDDTSQLSTGVTLTQAGIHTFRLEAFDGEKTAFDTIEVSYGAPPNYGLVPCGVIIDDPETPFWDETEDCELKHTFLLTRNVIDYTLWKITPLLIAIMAVVTGVIFYYSLGSANTLALVRRIWRAVIIGVIILLVSWFFLNMLLSFFGFDISVFGTWTVIEI